MRKRASQSCLCDWIFGISASCCDATTAYLCRTNLNRKNPAAFSIEGGTVDFDSAARFVVKGIQNANAPAILGVEHLGTRAQQICVDIARKCRGYIAYGTDSSDSLWRQGFVTATLGEVVDRSEVAVCVGVDLTGCHPRVANLLQQQDIETSLFSETVGQEICDLFSLARLMLEKPNSREALSCRNAAQKKSPVTLANAEELVRWVESKKCLTIFLDSQVNLIDNLTLDQVVAFSKSVHQFTKCYVIDLSSRSNDTSAGNVLAWSTGFANHVSFYSGLPEQLSVYAETDFDFVIRFCSEGQSIASPNEVLISSGRLESMDGTDQLMIQGLNYFPDSYARFDDVTCEIQTTGSNEKMATAIEFLSTVFERLGAKKESG